MRLSDLIKDKSKLTETERKSVEKMRPHIQPNLPKPKPPAQPEATPAKPPVDEEAKMKLEREYQERLREIEMSSKFMLEQKMQELEARYQRTAKQDNEAEQKKKAEAEKEQEAYRQKQEQMSAELAAAKKSAEEMQKKLQDELESLKNKEKQLDQEYSDRLTAEKERLEENKRSIEQQRAESEKRIEEERQKQAEASRVQKQSEAQPLPQPPEPTAHDEPKPVEEQPAVAPEPAPELRIQREVQPIPPAWSETHLVEAVKIAESLYISGKHVLDSIAEDREFSLVELNENISKAVRFDMEHPSEILTVAVRPYTFEDHFALHGVNVAIVMIVLSAEFEYTEQERVEISMAALLHDSGLCKVKEALNYPSQLKGHIKKEVISHPERGAEIFQGKLSEIALQTIRQHHEMCNGRGYPDGLSDKEIYIGAKILHVADAFEAMTHERPYRQHSMATGDAVKSLIETGKEVYDKKVLKAMMTKIGVYPVMTMVELSNQKIARVIRQNGKFPLSPLVQIEYDEMGKKMEKPSFLDLSRNQLVHIVGPTEEGQPYQSHHLGRRSHHTLRKSFIEAFLPHIILFTLIVIGLFLAFSL